MKKTHPVLSKLQRHHKNILNVSILLFGFMAISANAKVNTENYTTILTSVSSNTEYNFFGNIQANALTLDNTILNLADGKTFTLNDDLSVKGGTSAINAATIDLGSNVLTVLDDAELTLSGTASNGTVNLAGTLTGNLKETTLNVIDKDADFSDVAFDDVSFKISTTDYDVTQHIDTLLGINGITNINLDNSAPLTVNEGSTLDLGQVTLSGGVIDLEGTIVGNLKDTTLNLTGANADFSSANRDNVSFKVSTREYNVNSLLDVPDMTNVAFAIEDFDETDMTTINQTFSNGLYNVSFEKGTYNIEEAIRFNSNALTLAGAQVEITDADLTNLGNFFITDNTTITATSTTRDNDIKAYNSLIISGGHIVADGFEFDGYNGVEISGGTLVLSNDSEIASDARNNGQIPYLTISGGNITLNQSHLLSRSDIETKGVINITGGELTVNQGFIGAFNYSDGGLDGTHDSEGGEINISGGVVTFNGGNSIDDPTGWEGDDETGNFIANEILAQNINLSGNAQMNISEGANLKTTTLTRTDGTDIDFSVAASTIHLSDNSTLNLSGALRANIDKGSETAGTLNINNSAAQIIGNVNGVNMAINAQFNLNQITGNIGQLGNLDITAGGLTMPSGAIMVDNLTISGGETYLMGDGFFEGSFNDVRTSEILVNGVTNITGGILKIDSLVGLVNQGTGDLNITGGKVIGENSWNTQEEIQNDDTKMGNNIRHDGIGNINISGGEIDFTDHAAIVSRIGDINISGGTILLRNGAEIWSLNSDAKTIVSDNANITLTNDSTLAPEGTLDIQGGTITATESQVGSIGLFEMHGGTLTLNNGVFGSEGDRCADDSCHTGGQVIIAGGTINVNPLENVTSEVTGLWDYKANVLMGQDMTMSGGELNVSSGAILALRNGFAEDSILGDVSTLALTGGELNLSGSFDGHITAGSTAGTLNIQDANAQIIGNITGVNVAINEDFTTTDHLNGTVNYLGDVTLAAGKTLDLVLNGNLTDSDEDLNVKSFTMGPDSVLRITTSDYTPDEDRDLEATGPIQVTGTVDILHGGLKLDSENIVANFDMEKTNATIYDGEVVARSDGGNMNIKNSNINLEYSVIEKVYNGNLNITDGSTINLSQQGGIGAIISKADNNPHNLYFIPQNPTGDINVIDSTINMHANSAILRGDGDFDIVDDKLVFNGQAPGGNGNINMNNSTINMNDYSVIVMNNLDPAQGAMNIKNDSVLNVNGQNKILTDAAIEVEDSVINIHQDAILSLQNENIRPEEGGTIHLGQGGVLNLYGTLDGNIVGAEDASQAGTLNFMTEEADVTGIAHWLNIGIQANSTAVGEDIFIHNLTVGNDEKKAVLFTIDGDDEEHENARGEIASMTIKDGASVLIKAETAEWEEHGEYDGPRTHGASVSVQNLQVDEGATLTIISTGHHGAEIMDIETANLSGTINLINGLIEGDDEDPNATISILNANVNMSGEANMEAGGVISVQNSTMVMDTNDYGLVSSSLLNVKNSAVSLSTQGHLIAYKGFDEVSGDLNILDGSVINMAGASLLSGDTVNIIDSELNIQGNGYIIAHQDEINIQNSSVTISNEKTLAVLAGEDPGEIDDENYDTIIEAYQALNPTSGTLKMQNDSALNLSGNLYADAHLENSILNIGSPNATIHGTTTLSGSSVLNLGINKLTTDTLNVNAGTTVNFTVAGADNYGSIRANQASISSENTTLNLTLNNGVINYDDEVGMTIQLIDADDYDGAFGTLNKNNNRYGFQDLGNGNYQIYGLGISAASIVANAGGSLDTQVAATAWLDTPNSGANQGIANHLEALAQNNAAGLAKAVEVLQPETVSVRVETATSNNLQIANATTTRLNNLTGVDTRGRAGGDATLQSNIWAQGLHNKSKLDTSNGFSSKTYGVAMGFDTKPLEDTIVGIGYAYTKTDLDAAQKSTDIESHTAMLYGQQTIGDAFINAVVTYGFNRYDETRNGAGISDSAKYNMDSVFTQVMTGYNFNLDAVKITPKVGLRYLWTHMHNYTDSAHQYVQSDNTNTVTGVIGATIASDFNVHNFVLTPKFALAGTYDFKQDGGRSTVTLANGANYVTRGDTLKRFGIESGIGLNVTYDNLEFGIQYEGRFKKNYRDHTGLINFRYNF